MKCEEGFLYSTIHEEYIAVSLSRKLMLYSMGGFIDPEWESMTDDNWTSDCIIVVPGELIL